MTAAPLLKVEGLSVEHVGPRGAVLALDSVSLELEAGSVLSIAGESGSGKSTLVRAVLGLVRARSGRVELTTGPERSIDLTRARGAGLRAARRRIGFVPQDPGASLNPRLRALDALVEVLEAHGVATGEVALERALAGLVEAGLERRHAVAFPHELSGGERQRVALARALVAEPALLVCDEVLSALDPLAAQGLLARLAELARTHRRALLFVTHDLRAARELGGELAILHAGRLVERGPVAQVLDQPRQAASRALVEAHRRLAGA